MAEIKVSYAELQEKNIDLDKLLSSSELGEAERMLFGAEQRRICTSIRGKMHWENARTDAGVSAAHQEHHNISEYNRRCV